MIRIIAIAVLLHSIAVFAGEEATDAEIMEYLMNSTLYIDNFEGARWDFQHARDLCGGNSNRFARLICELAHTNNTRTVRSMVRRLGFYGTPAQLPFLYSQISNTEYGVEAARAVLAIEGVTSNSVAVVETYLSLTNMPMPSREDLCLSLLDRRGGVSLEMSNLVEQCAYRFFAKDRVYSGWYDNMVCARIADYRLSKRRLRVLRSVSDLGLNQYNESFVTNAINELVAYPEADLPD